MNIHTFGDKNNKAVILIHGMLTPWQMWQDAMLGSKKEVSISADEERTH